MKRQSSGSFSRVLYAVTGLIHLLTHFWRRFSSVQLALARMSWSSPQEAVFAVEQCCCRCRWCRIAFDVTVVTKKLFFRSRCSVPSSVVQRMYSCLNRYITAMIGSHNDRQPSANQANVISIRGMTSGGYSSSLFPDQVEAEAMLGSSPAITRRPMKSTRASTTMCCCSSGVIVACVPEMCSS